MELKLESRLGASMCLDVDVDVNVDVDVGTGLGPGTSRDGVEVGDGVVSGYFIKHVAHIELSLVGVTWLGTVQPHRQPHRQHSPGLTTTPTTTFINTTNSTHRNKWAHFRQSLPPKPFVPRPVRANAPAG